MTNVSNEENVAAADAVVDMRRLESLWSSESQNKLDFNPATQKVRSLQQNSRSLCAGHYCISRFRNLATISLLFSRMNKEDGNEEYYGLTVAGFLDDRGLDGNIFADFEGKIGDPIYALNKDEVENKECRPVIEIGYVVAIDRATDSCIFKLYRHIHAIPLKLSLTNGFDQDINLEAASAKHTLSKMSKMLLAGYGANARGSLGRCIDEFGCEGHNIIFSDDLMIEPLYPDVFLCATGDLGTLVVDERCVLVGMFHAELNADAKADDKVLSCCVPFHKIMDAHRQFFLPTAINAVKDVNETRVGPRIPVKQLHVKGTPDDLLTVDTNGVHQDPITGRFWGHPRGPGCEIAGCSEPTSYKKYCIIYSIARMKVIVESAIAPTPDD